MFFILPLICSFLVGTGNAVDPPIKTVPMKYVTTETYQLSSNEKTIFQADIDCDNLKGSTVNVCAELPDNWQWDPFRGYVYLNLFNNSADVSDLNKALVSTGKPHSGSGTVPAQCIRLPKWPGGTLMVRVDANNYSPIFYALSVEVFTNAPKEISHQQSRRVSPPPAAHLAPVRDGAVIQLTPVVALSETLSLKYDEDITLEINVCLNHYQPDYLMTSSIIATEGTFTHFLCDALPCLPDSGNVICSEDSPLPVTVCAAGLNGKPKQVYVTVHAAGGKLNSTAGVYVSSLKFGASFTTIQN